ncbi:hypothetical protein C1H46_035051 [Malus baccata]|uniref:Uncharacterized protein n=1 Tax=Malus baccata TaxID=106549 RepID=A0A540KYU7_MALBA|nr:hypothetical protein C1H46_035051 [Malus baccata]
MWERCFGSWGSNLCPKIPNQSSSSRFDATHRRLTAIPIPNPVQMPVAVPLGHLGWIQAAALYTEEQIVVVLTQAYVEMGSSSDIVE